VDTQPESSGQPNEVDKEFEKYLQIAHVTRELWWVPYDVVAEMDSKMLAAFRMKAAEFQAKHYEELAKIMGDDLITLLLKKKEDGGYSLARMVNKMNLANYKQEEIFRDALRSS
jgi:hypothetical protein